MGDKELEKLIKVFFLDSFVAFYYNSFTLALKFGGGHLIRIGVQSLLTPTLQICKRLIVNYLTQKPLLAHAHLQALEKFKKILLKHYTMMNKDEKICFVIMPISDFSPYQDGHFKRVYNYIIRPACEKAGFTPIRGDDILNTNYIALDIIKKVTTADMAICDLSGRNPNVLYELGIRQAFNLPITLIKDTQTNRIFDIQGFRDIEYDELLRIDNVENTIEVIANTLINTYKSKGSEINSLVSLLSIEPAKIENKTISADTELILNYLNDINNRINDLENKNKIADERTKQPNIIYRSYYGGGLIGDDNAGMRLSLIAKKVNTGISSIVDLLSKNGIIVENNPNTRIGIDEIKIIEAHFNVKVLDDRLSQLPNIA